MQLVIVGLGNPGEKYAFHRHNIGFRIVDEIASLYDIQFKKERFFKRFLIGKGTYNKKTFSLVKPLTFMNRSGEILKHVIRYTGAELSELLVIYDNLDLPVGACRLKLRGSSAGHKGLDSIIKAAGTEDIRRCAIGIGRPGENGNVIRYVLERPSKNEELLLRGTVELVSKTILSLVSESPQKIMNILNSKKENNVADES